MAERLPQGAFKQGRQVPASSTNLETPNGTHVSAASDATGLIGIENVPAVVRPYSVNTTITNIRDLDLNGATSPRAISSPLSVREPHALDSPRSTSSPRTGQENEFGGLQSRAVAAPVRAANRATDGNTNGSTEAAHQSEEGSRAAGSNAFSENGREPESDWVEQDEPGVYITLTALPGGGKDLKRVRFR